MEELDRELQKRVWQRVQNREEPVLPAEDNLKALILTAQENAVAYQRLARQVSQKDRERLLRLHRESKQCIACLRGICRLRGEQVKEPRLPGTKEQPHRALEKCYHRERKLWSEWERRASDGEHGAVFAGLSRQAREHCMALMEMLGEMA